MEQLLLRRLAIFADGFTLAAVTAAMNDLRVTSQMVQEGIANLVAKSLVTLDRSISGGRWMLLESIRVMAVA